MIQMTRLQQPVQGLLRLWDDDLYLLLPIKTGPAQSSSKIPAPALHAPPLPFPPLAALVLGNQSLPPYLLLCEKVEEELSGRQKYLLVSLFISVTQQMLKYPL